eukprot:TRINITY_DN3760_c0_g1_i2.p1 TRINITY_DN3760_c0_g1~~TRINITY_DN3760_c0_g1_i2.p1  ORF type:complete len:231 (+),score=-18.17 TRINITY_DN3760_c0_g1_i2:242-934(+)
MQFKKLYQSKAFLITSLEKQLQISSLNYSQLRKSHPLQSNLTNQVYKKAINQIIIQKPLRNYQWRLQKLMSLKQNIIRSMIKQYTTNSYFLHQITNTHNLRKDKVGLPETMSGNQVCLENQYHLKFSAKRSGFKGRKYVTVIIIIKPTRFDEIWGNFLPLLEKENCYCQQLFCISKRFAISQKRVSTFQVSKHVHLKQILNNNTQKNKLTKPILKYIQQTNIFLKTIISL